MVGLIWAIFEGSNMGSGGPPPTGQNFTIIVENGANPNQKIAGATVTYGTLSQMTDSTGAANFTNAPAGPLPLSASAQGFNNYGPTQFTPIPGNPGPYFVPLLATTGGIPYAESFTFVDSQEFVGVGSAQYKNVNTVAITASVTCVVKNNIGQTISLGTSALQTVQPGQTVRFGVVLSAVLAHGTYTFSFFAQDDQNRPITAGETTVTATV